MANVVNLDALIPREDLAVLKGQADVRKVDTIAIRDLEEKSFFYLGLRKPDFQRETANWTPQKIADLVKTFMSGDLIPAVILWQAGKDVFVIDGAHRLSALLAWVHNDYGDGLRSTHFFQGFIPEDQKKAAERTKKLIESEIGSYAEHLQASQHPEHAKPDVLERAKRLGFLSIQLQWVQTEDVRKAENSFFKINQAATAIDPIELQILQSRTCANAIAARAVARRGTGNQYWSHFPQSTQDQIVKVAVDIYNSLYVPPIDLPIKTLDLPVAGPAYGGQTLPLLFDLINFANDVKPVTPKKRKGSETELSDAQGADEDGSKTLAYLTTLRRLVYRIAGVDPTSLGLHPALYFYSIGGSFQYAALLGACEFVRELEQADKLKDFTEARGRFENFFLAHKDFTTEVVHRFGSGQRSAGRIKSLYDRVFAMTAVKADENVILASLSPDPDFVFLVAEKTSPRETAGAKFGRKTKSAAFLQSALDNALRCPLCSGLMHKNSMVVDHKERREDGGTDGVGNAQMVHPYCNNLKH